jgi:hypothetical protein
VKDKSPEEQLDWFMSKYTPEIHVLAPAPSWSDSEARLPEWSKIMRRKAGDKIIEFRSFDLYCFLDMTQFFTTAVTRPR